jgi:hypothetical protein
MENLKIEAVEEKFMTLTEVNNYEWEIFEHKLSNGEKSYSIIVNDFLKYPDEFAKLLSKFPHFDNYQDNTGRPGKTFLFAQPLNYRCSFFIRKLLFNIFKIDTRCGSLYTNCMPGRSDRILITPPHIDLVDVYDHRLGPSIVANLGLTKNVKNNGTSFWTFRGKRSPLDMTIQEINEYESYHDKLKKTDITYQAWNNNQTDKDWNLEYIVPMNYNSLVCYSPTWFHQPSYDKNEFIEKDRFSLASFFDVKMEEIHDMPTELIPDAFDIWKKFDLCKLYNYYF